MTQGKIFKFHHTILPTNSVSQFKYLTRWFKKKNIQFPMKKIKSISFQNPFPFILDIFKLYDCLLPIEKHLHRDWPLSYLSQIFISQAKKLKI